MSGNFYSYNEKIENQINDLVKKDNLIYDNLNNYQKQTFKLIKRYELYNQTKNWVPIYYKNYFSNKILKELIPFFVAVLFFNLIFILYSKSNYLSFGNLKIKNKIFYFINIFNFFILILFLFIFLFLIS